MRHVSGDLKRGIGWFLIVMFFFGGVAMGVTEMKTIEGNVWYRERIMLPPTAEVRVILEDVAKMDVKAERIAETSFTPQGGPPWEFTLDYDPSKIHERGRYALRARIEANGQLLFINTEHIAAFAQDPGTPVKILVSMVSRPKTSETTPASTPDASLTNTYWKLIEVSGEPASLGAGQKELNMILVGEGSRVKGFAGCNRFSGGYTIKEDRIQFSQMASTRMACVDTMEQEQRFFYALNDTDRFEVNGNDLSLFGSDGEMLLQFEAVN